MIHYHGGRHSTQEIAVRIWKARHALVSFAEPQQIAIAAEVAQSFVLDNGAFSVWKQGSAVDWKEYYAWVDEWRTHPGFDWAIIPDVIEGDENANDELIAHWPFRTAGTPVWHLHEPVRRLQSLADSWPRVALGSSGAYRTPGTAHWWARMNEALVAICDRGRPRTKLHGLRMLRPDLFSQLPLASADSAGVSRSIGTTNWGGVYRQASDLVKALVLIDSYESRNSAPQWRGIPHQEDLFA